MKKIVFATSALLVSAGTAFAGGCGTDAFGNPDPNCVVDVPEISALEGTAALAAIAAIVLVAWERRRRAV